MADILIPIALSSQLDVTGEERIHAASYTPTTRSTYVVPEIPSPAIQLLMDIDHWWSFDGDLTDQVGTATMDIYGNDGAYQAGLKNQEGRGTEALIADLDGVGQEGSCSFWGWVHVVGSGSTGRALFGLTTQVVGVGGFRKYVSVGLGGTIIAGTRNDNATNNSVTTTVTPGQRYFVRLNYDIATLRVGLYVNEVFVGWTAPGIADVGCAYFGLHDNSGSDFVPLVDYVDEIGLIKSRMTTEEEGAYLYAEGLGKSWDELVEDGTV